jgi:hypothetical protein
MQNNSGILIGVVALVAGVFIGYGIGVQKSPSMPSAPDENVPGYVATSTNTNPDTTKPGSKESATGPCYIGGCSAQVCSGQKDVASNCEFRPEYACFKAATCERQATGVCGWTETAELTTCLSNAKAN